MYSSTNVDGTVFRPVENGGPVTIDIPAMRKFCSTLNMSKMYAEAMAGNQECIITINRLLAVDELDKYISIELTTHMFNGMQLKSSENHLEIYVTPRFLKRFIPVMDAFVKECRIAFKGFSNVSFTCYKPYNFDKELPVTITLDKETIRYADCAVKSHIIMTHDNKPMLALEIVVRTSVAKKVLKSVKVKFNSPGGITERNVLIPSTSAMYILLSEVIGEHNLLNYVGYIEYTPSNERKKQMKDYTRLNSLKPKFVEIAKRWNRLKCDYCGHDSLQSKIMKCSVCKSAYYCSVKCQRSMYSDHKIVCKPAKETQQPKVSETNTKKTA